MTIMARDTRKEWTQCPEGLHQAVCVDVVDLGDQQTQFGIKHQVRLIWQVDETNPDDGKRFRVQKKYTLSLNEKANLRKDLECWRGCKFNAQELEGFDLERLLAVNCQLQIIHNLTDEGKTYANIQAIIAAAKGIPKIAPEGYVREKDRAKQQNIADEIDEMTADNIPF